MGFLCPKESERREETGREKERDRKRERAKKGEGKRERERTKAQAILFLNCPGQSEKSTNYTVLYRKERCSM